LKVLITGARGFIGANLAVKLVSAGHQVRALDISAGVAPGGVEMIRGDVSDPETCRSACAGVDAVVHGAAIHHIDKVSKRPERTLGVNVSGALNMLRGAAAEGVGRFVYLSTAKVYGNPESMPSRESDYPEPIEIYALSKLAGEHYCRLFQEAGTLDVAVIRPFSVYGPGQSLDTGYVGMLINALMTGEPLTIPGRPDYLRDFVHVDDVMRLCVQVITQPITGGLQVLNAGSGTACTLAQLVELAGHASDRPVLAEYIEPGAATITRSLACMDVAADILGFEPRISLAEGLQQTLDWFRQVDASGRLAGS